MDDHDQARFPVTRNAAEESAIPWEGEEKAQGVSAPGGRRAIMNDDILKGKWKEIKGGVKVKWGRITHDGFTRVEGNTEKILGLLQQKYGHAKDKAGLEYKHFVSR